MSRFANLADKPKNAARPNALGDATSTNESKYWPDIATAAKPAASRIGRKAISAYFSPEMSFAMHVCARKQGISLQALMAEAFDDVLRKYGESPVGD